MPDELDDFKRLTNDLFRVRLDQVSNLELVGIPKSVFPTRLVLTLQERPPLEAALLTSDRGATLEVDMTWPVAMKVYQQIWQVSQTMDLPLPKINRKPTLNAFIRIDIGTAIMKKSLAIAMIVCSVSVAHAQATLHSQPKMIEDFSSP